MRTIAAPRPIGSRAAAVLGLLLAALFVAGRATHAQPWLAWLDGIAALLTFVLASAQEARARTVFAIVMVVLLSCLFIAGLAMRAQWWLVWGTFAAACAMAVIGYRQR